MDDAFHAPEGTRVVVLAHGDPAALPPGTVLALAYPPRSRQRLVFGQVISCRADDGAVYRVHVRHLEPLA